MKKLVTVLTLLAMSLVVINTANAQLQYPTWGWGIEVGAARGDNGGDESWVPGIRASAQWNFAPYFGSQFGVSYADLTSEGLVNYSAQALTADARLLFTPFKMKSAFPYIYAGVGVTKDMKGEGSGFLPTIPAGFGVQSQLGDQLLLQINAGYNLVLSDELVDGGRNGVNSYTNGAHDGFFAIMAGIVYTMQSQKANVKTPKAPVAEFDTDKDGLSDLSEKEYLTDPKNPDTDGDGLSDGDEVKKYHSDPMKTDTDGDGLTDGNEVSMYHSDPTKPDSDGDGLNDGVEVTQYKTDANKADSDNDGLTDADEIRKYKTDPTKQDSDGDGVTDGDEVLKFRSDPLKTDTDGDGLSDSDEVNKYKTDPTKTDTDGDGLSDYAEVSQFHTDPLKVDTDGGGMNDGAEIKFSKNPLDVQDDLFDLSKGKKVILRGINFATNKSKVLPESEYVLEKARASMEANPDATVVISGHTDSVGNDDSNRTLSQKRAQAVKDWLVKKGIASSRLKVVGKGEAEPMSSNDTDDGRADNRRIEFSVE